MWNKPKLEEKGVMDRNMKFHTYKIISHVYSTLLLCRCSADSSNSSNSINSKRENSYTNFVHSEK